MDDVGGGNLVDDIKKLIKTEGNLRLVFDNFDFKILANIILQNHRNADMHWIAQFATFDRIPCDNFDDTKPLVADINVIENKEYLLTKEELEQMKTDFVTLVMKVLVEFFPSLDHLKSEVHGWTHPT